MPRKRRESRRKRLGKRKETQRANRKDVNKSTGSSSGTGDPAPSRGKSLNALRLAPPQGSLPTQEKGIPLWSDSLKCDCAPVSAPSPKCEAGQTQLADSLPSVCTPKSVPSPPCDAASRLLAKDARNIEQDSEENSDIYETSKSENITVKQYFDSSKHKHDIIGLSDNPDNIIRVIQGSLHQGHSFFGPNAGKQCVANSLSFIAYSSIHSVDSWLSEDLDSILHTGNELYSYLQSSSTMKNNYLLINELPEKLDIFDTVMRFHYGNSLVGLLRDSVHADFLDLDTEKLNLSLNSALRKCFSRNEYCFVTFAGNTFAVQHQRNAFHVFDSHARSLNGTVCSNGKAILLSFADIQGLVLHCYSLAKSLGVLPGFQFELTSVNSQKVTYSLRTIGKHTTENMKKTNSNLQDVEHCDVELSRIEFVPLQFRPLEAKGKQSAIDKLMHLSKTCCKFLRNVYQCQSERHDPICKAANTPSTIHNIKGDGNCFFRAISYSLFDTEDYHECLRHMTCEFLQQNQEFLSKFTSAYNSSYEYLQKSSMPATGTWATEIEIIALSAILETSIYTFSNRKWLRYNANGVVNEHGIYLYHANCNHYDVVLDVMNSPEDHDGSLNCKAKTLEKEKMFESRNTFTNCFELMEKYFHHQKEQQKLKTKMGGIQSRKDYMQLYMQNWRKKERNRLKESNQDKVRKQKSRLDLTYRSNERVKDRLSKSKKRMDNEKRIMEKRKNTEMRSLIRKNEEIKNKEKERERIRKCKERQNSTFRSNEKVRDKIARSEARKDDKYRVKEKERDKNWKLMARQSEICRKSEKEKDKNAKSIARKRKDFREMEREREKVWKVKARKSETFRTNEKIKEKGKRSIARTSNEKLERERKRDADRKRKLRKEKCFKENERLAKCAARANDNKRQREKLYDKTNKALKRKNKDYTDKEKEASKKRKYGKDLSECISIFKRNIEEGPVYVCTCCHQTWFSHSVSNSISTQDKCNDGKLQECFMFKISDERGIEWICNTCKLSINIGKVPKLAIANNIGFPKRPPELNLHQLEERLIALRIPFMQIRELPRGGQLSIKGNIVNVPVEIQPTVNSLPRPFDENITVSVRLKKKLSYKSCDLTENVRPLHVIAALHWLMKHSDLYKSSGIEIDDDWISRISRNSHEILKEYMHDRSLDKDNETFEEIADCNFAVKMNKEDHIVQKNKEEIDDFVEIDERETNSGNCDTIIEDANIIQENIYSFAPGEGQSPLGLYNDPDSEYLSFPSIYCGQRRPENRERHVKVNYSDIVKWELRSVDRRAAQNVPNIFYKMKKIQMKQISDKVNLVLRRCKTEGKKLTAKDVLDPKRAENLARLDEGYFIFRTLRNSPPYLEGKKKELFAMIRQLGLPTWFVSLSAADTRWADQLSMLSKLNTGKTLNAEDIDQMSWAEKTELVKKDPVNSVRYFNHRVQEFISTVLKSDHNPIGKVSDFFYRVEFQHRGSPHIHMLLWIKNAPIYQKDSIEDVTAFVDKYVSCSLDVKTEEKDFVEMQMHRHSKSCKKRGRNVCRFNFPLPPMTKTTILEPLDDADLQKYKKLYCDIQKHLSKEKQAVDFQELLKRLGITEEEYIKAIRSSLQGPKVFLKRQSNEIRVNPYMRNLLTAWGANHDLQFVLDPFACVVYIVNYISKAQRGMSTLLDEACKEARNGDFDLRRQVRHMGNKFLNCVEISAQEASYLNLQLPLTQSTRDCVFINTAPPSQRTFLLKHKDLLEKLPENSTDIEADNIIKRYSKRPKMLEEWCLADYAAELNIVYPKKENADNSEEDVNDDDKEREVEKNETGDTSLNITLKNGIKIKQRLIPRLIRYVRYSLKVDPENFFRERILLFYPWRVEEIDVIGSFDSYEEHYLTIKETLLPKVAKYEKNAEELDRAQTMAAEVCNEDQFSNIAPGNEQSQLDAAAEGIQESQPFAVFDPRRPENQRNYDIGQDLGLPVCNLNHDEIIPRRMANDDYFANVRTLNIKQREFFLHVLHWIQTKEEPLRAFLTGGAGVGKSVVVRLLHEALMRQLGSQDGQNPDLLRVLLCAPTGKAAYNIGGVTIHSAFGIPASQGFKCKPLTSDSLNSLRTKYRQLSVVIIDEVSMVGNMMFNLIHERLKQIRGSKDYFGGVHVILIGDLFQLKPVMDGWIFENLKADFGPLATNLWCDLFEMHELSEIMRQKDDLIFSELLNRLREGNHTNTDLEVLKTRVVGTSSQHYPRMAPHLFISNKSVNDFNIQVFNSVQNEKTIVKSMDCFIGGHKSLNHKLQSIPKDASKTAGLHSEVHLGIGLKYEVTANLSVSDGITNGTSCTLKLIDRRQNSSRPSIIWVLFEKPFVGMEWRYQYRHLYTNSINKLWTPIFDVKRSFTYLRHNVMRIQFPLRIAAAKTVHKSQGDTVDQIVVDLTTNYKLPHVHYVALSRVRSMSGLSVLALNEHKMSVSDKVKEEMKRLRENAVLQLCYRPVYANSDSKFKVGVLNIRSLQKHVKEIQSDLNFTACNVIAITETWLKEYHEDKDISLQNFVTYRQDGASRSRGIMLYCHKDITVQEVGGHIDTDVEFYILDVKNLEQSYQIAVLYRAQECNRTKFKQVITEKLKPLLDEERNIIIAGDFNYDLLKYPSSFQEELQSIIKCKQVVKKATHESGSLLDHFYTNTECKYTDVIETVFSDHKFVYACF